MVAAVGQALGLSLARLNNRLSAIVVAAATAFSVSGCARDDALPAIDPPALEDFSAERIERGDRLAAIGDCFGCHTATDGLPYAGGVAIRTPFGTVVSTNVTPDPDNGIGRWSTAAFRRAMRDGISRDGHRLYPAFPYPHFRRLDDADIEALYAFLMTREPIRSRPAASSVLVPRPLVAVWNALFLEDDARPGRSDAPPTRDAFAERGRYLVDALAHCSACHSPRNVLGAERRDHAFSGGDAEGWHAPALDSSSPSPVPWTVDALAQYLRTGIADAHAMTAGPMSIVVRNLARATDDDIRAIATYIVSLDKRTPDERAAQQQRSLATTARGPMTPDVLVPGISLFANVGRDGSAVDPNSGLAIYDGACAQCHDRGRETEGGALQLPLAVALSMPVPDNLIRIIRDGIIPATHEHGRWMPDYAGALTDQQMANLVAYLRAFTGLPAWNGVHSAVKRARSS